MNFEEQEFRKKLSDWLIEKDTSTVFFDDETEEAVWSLCFEYPSHVRKMTFEFLDEFKNSEYVQNLKNKILAHSL